MRRLSASKIGLAERCAYWLRDDAPEEKEVSRYARLGNALHEFAELDGDISLQQLARKWSLPPGEVKRLEGMASGWAKVFKPKIRSDAMREVKFGWDPETGDVKVLRSTDENGNKLKPRDYSDAPAHWVTGTADLVQWTDDTKSCLYVVDYKSGFWVEDSEDSVQLESLSLMASRALRVDMVRATNVKTQEKICYELPYVERDWFDLDAAERRMRDVHLRVVPDATPEAGTWCKSGFCPARNGCAAFAAWERMAG